MANAVELADNFGNKITSDNPLPVTGSVDGALDDAAWDGVAEEATMIALLKAIHAQLVIIADNTAPV